MYCSTHSILNVIYNSKILLWPGSKVTEFGMQLFFDINTYSWFYQNDNSWNEDNWYENQPHIWYPYVELKTISGNVLFQEFLGNMGLKIPLFPVDLLLMLFYKLVQREWDSLQSLKIGKMHTISWNIDLASTSVSSGIITTLTLPCKLLIPAESCR